MILPEIKLFRGATSSIDLDLTEWDMNVGTCLFTLRNTSKDVVLKEVLMDTSTIHTIIFKDEETINYSIRDQYSYDIMLVVGEERYPQSERSPVSLREVMGRYEPTN